MSSINKLNSVNNSNGITLIRSTASGALSKAWYKIGDKTCLVKGDSMFCYEPFSEAYASVIADVLGVKHIKYELDYAYKYPEVETTKHGIVSVCEIYNIGEGNSRLSLWDYICEVCNERVLNPRMITTDDAFSITLELDRSVVNKIFDVLYFDSIICNVDRHMRNIELIRDDNRYIADVIPVFDCGSSLLYTNSNDWDNDACSAFKYTHSEQVKQIINSGYVNNISKVPNFSDLFEFGASDIFKQDPREGIKDKLIDFLKERIALYV